MFSWATWFCILLGLWFWLRSRPSSKGAKDAAVVSTEPESVWAKYPLRPSLSEIRLLEIISPTNLHGAETDPIVVRFHVVSLKEQPQYHALSYVWGDPNNAEAITLRVPSVKDGNLIDSRVDVTANLAMALRYLRGHQDNLPRESSVAPAPLRIWIDALCINQQDPVERGQQVAIMKEIYINAEYVLASLSPDKDFSPESLDRVFQGIPLLSDMFKDMTTEGELLGLKWLDKHDVFNRMDIQAKTPEDEARYKEDVQVVTNHMWDTLDRFPRSTYFKRIWIMQEICLAKKLIFLYKRQRMDWEQVIRVVLRLDEVSHNLQNQTGLGPIEAEHNPNFRPFIHNKLAIRDSARHLLWLWTFGLLRKERKELDLDQKWTVSRLVQSMDATKPKDYIYGTLGLTGFDITPNYTEAVSVDRVYAEQVAAWLSDWPILTTQHKDESLELEFLSYSGLGVPRREGAAKAMECSWVPALHCCNFGATIPATPTCSRTVLTLESAPPASICLELLELSVSGIAVGRSKQPDPVPVNQLFRSEYFVESFLRYILGYTPENMMYFNSFITGDRPLPEFPYQSPMLNLFRLETFLDLPDDEPLFLTYTLQWLTNIGLARELRYSDEGDAVCDGENWQSLQVSPSMRFVDWYADNFTRKSMHLKALEEMLDVTHATEVKSDGGEGEDESTSGGGFLRPNVSTYMQHSEFVSQRARVADYNRRVFQTTNGLIGMGPEGVQEGDILVVFRESGQPSMLRRVEGEEDKWLHIGQCFVPELLQGEAGGWGLAERFILV
jgi:hypothetical protein